MIVIVPIVVKPAIGGMQLDTGPVPAIRSHDTMGLNGVNVDVTVPSGAVAPVVAVSVTRTVHSTEVKSIVDAPQCNTVLVGFNAEAFALMSNVPAVL